MSAVETPTTPDVASLTRDFRTRFLPRAEAFVVDKSSGNELHKPKQYASDESTSWSTTPESKPAPPILDTTEAQYDKVLDINLKSAFFGTQIAAKQMIAQGDGGRIINITSVHEDWPMPNNTAYCLSKGGMRMLTRTAGVELAPHGVLVVGVGPGAVDTPINASTAADPAKMKTLDAAIPIGRMAQPHEIGSVVAFLAGDGASYLAATTIFADGGIMHSSPGL